MLHVCYPSSSDSCLLVMRWTLSLRWRFGSAEKECSKSWRILDVFKCSRFPGDVVRHLCVFYWKLLLKSPLSYVQLSVEPSWFMLMTLWSLIFCTVPTVRQFFVISSVQTDPVYNKAKQRTALSISDSVALNFDICIFIKMCETGEQFAARDGTDVQLL